MMRALVSYGVAVVIGLGLGAAIINLNDSIETENTCSADIALAGDKVILGAGTALGIIASALEDPTQYNLLYAEKELEGNLPQFKAQSQAYQTVKDRCDV